MSLLSVLSSPWAIEQGALNEVAAQLLAYRGKELHEVEASFAALLAASKQQMAYQTRADGVAVLRVAGVMTPHLSWLSALFGGTSTHELGAQLNAMASDPAVKAALVVWDSPGGNVSGVPSARDAMRRLAAAKPTASMVQGVMASAAYWVGSAARAVYVEGATDVVGSLGVYMRFGWNAAEPNSMEIVRGKFKRASINGEAPSAEFIQHIEGQADYLYSTLIGDVAQHRGATAEQTHARMGDGRLFLGRQALDAGLADGEMSIEAAANMLATRPAEVQRSKAQATMGQHSLVHNMDRGPKPLAALPSAPAPAPAATAAPVATMTKADAVQMIQQRADREGLSFSEAAGLLDPDGTVLAALPPGQMPKAKPLPRSGSPESHALAKEAQQLAASRGIPYVQALKQLGY